MSAHDELTDDERSVLAFVQADFKKHNMHRALAMVQNPNIKVIDLRTVINSYRDRWRRQQRGHLKLVR